MEVAAGDDIDAVAIAEDERVIGDGVELDIEHPTGVGNGIAGGTVHLRNAAKGVSVLDVGGIVGTDELAALEDGSQAGCAIDLTRKWAEIVNAFVKGESRSVQSFEAHAGGDIGHAADAFGADRFENAESAHHSGAVGEREAFFGGKSKGRKAGAAQSFTTRKNFALILGLTFTDERQAHVG